MSSSKKSDEPPKMPSTMRDKYLANLAEKTEYDSETCMTYWKYIFFLKRNNSLHQNVAAKFFYECDPDPDNYRAAIDYNLYWCKEHKTMSGKQLTAEYSRIEALDILMYSFDDLAALLPEQTLTKLDRKPQDDFADLTVDYVVADVGREFGKHHKTLNDEEVATLLGKVKHALLRVAGEVDGDARYLFKIHYISTEKKKEYAIPVYVNYKHMNLLDWKISWTGKTKNKNGDLVDKEFSKKASAMFEDINYDDKHYEKSVWTPWRGVKPTYDKLKKGMVFNTFSGIRAKYLQPHERVSTQVIKDYMLRCFSQGNVDYHNLDLDILADRLQNPDQQSCIVPVYIGPQGILKTKFFTEFFGKMILGRANIQRMKNDKQSNGEFNSLMANKLLLILDDYIQPTTALQKGLYLMIKELTGSEDITIRPLYGEHHDEQNYALVMMMLNDIGGIYIEGGDRRYWVQMCDPSLSDKAAEMESSVMKRKNEHDGKVIAAFKSEAVANSFYSELIDREILGYPGIGAVNGRIVKVPTTPWKQEICERRDRPPIAWITAVYRGEGAWIGAIGVEELNARYAGWYISAGWEKMPTKVVERELCKPNPHTGLPWLEKIIGKDKKTAYRLFIDRLPEKVVNKEWGYKRPSIDANSNQVYMFKHTLAAVLPPDVVLDGLPPDDCVTSYSTIVALAKCFKEPKYINSEKYKQHMEVLRPFVTVMYHEKIEAKTTKDKHGANITTEAVDEYLEVIDYNLRECAKIGADIGPNSYWQEHETDVDAEKLYGTKAAWKNGPLTKPRRWWEYRVERVDVAANNCSATSSATNSTGSSDAE